MSTEEGARLSRNTVFHLGLAAFSASCIAAALLFSDAAIPEGMITRPWFFNVNLGEWAPVALVLLAWGIGLNLLVAIIFRDQPPTREEVHPFLAQGCIASITAGVVEELHFRYLVFLGACAWLHAVDLITFGAAEAVYAKALFPILDVVTLRSLTVELLPPSGWHVGAALVAANGFFRDDHRAQGGFNRLNSWFLGFALFWLMFRAGLPAAMLVHFLYDFCVIFTHRLTTWWRLHRALRHLRGERSDAP